MLCGAAGLRIGRAALQPGRLPRLTSLAAAEKAMASVKTKFGRIDALCNIAGGFLFTGLALYATYRMRAANPRPAVSPASATS